MADDWRLRADLGDHEAAERLSQLLTAHDLEHDLSDAYSQQVAISVDDGSVFCYAGSQEQTEAAEQVIRRLAGENGWNAQIAVTRWHPTSERWEDPSVPLPTDAAGEEREREQRVADERAESTEQGYPEYEVRIHCNERREARDLAERLEAEGLHNVHRLHNVLVGATDEDEAQALATRIRSELPGADVTVGRNERAIYEDAPRNPFRWLGGLGG
jgi:hypothetical protein